MSCKTELLADVIVTVAAAHSADACKATDAATYEEAIQVSAALRQISKAVEHLPLEAALHVIQGLPIALVWQIEDQLWELGLDESELG